MESEGRQMKQCWILYEQEIDNVEIKNILLKMYQLPGSNQLGGHLSQLELVVLRLWERLPKLFPNLNYADLQYQDKIDAK